MATPSSQVLLRKSLRRAFPDESRVTRNGASSEQTDYRKPDVEREPSQNSLVVFYHFLMTVFYLLLFYHGYQLVSGRLHILDPEGKIPRYGGPFKYLTHINQALQFLFFGLQFLTNLLAASSSKLKMQKFCDLMFTSVIAPTAFFIIITFWTMYSYDRSLVYPERFDLVIPQYMNHFWHSAIAVWVLIEIILCHHRHPSTKVATCVIFIVSMAYLSWISWVYVQTGYWPYGILRKSSLSAKIFLIAGCEGFHLLLYFICKTISEYRWSNTVRSV